MTDRTGDLHDATGVGDVSRASSVSSAASDSRPVSGAQYAIRSGGYAATIASVGATLRTLTFEGRDLVVPFEADELRPAFRGATLAPWPNRVVDGTYEFDGEERQLALTEPSRGHALHGLVGWLDFAAARVDDDRVELVATIEPQQGYPTRVEVRVEFSVSAAGLETVVTGTNVSASAAPWGVGPHPYLVAGPGHVDDWLLELPASTVALIEGERLLPAGLALVEATEFDFREPRLLGDVFIDHAFSSVTRAGGADSVGGEGGGDATVTVTTADGSGVAISFGPELPWVQVHTADQPDVAVSRIGLAVEPMTCPPDAFSTGDDLVRLEPGESHRAAWTISAVV
ncbi:aldose 1-epimerase family protein [Frigoribacterium sp. 2-23]|uniref:aldose 1-epimerase family protein n=1 Tax=Frigoribacterium sp. 2-23 TaxID=3415006 RepID=UPI003C6FE0A9